MTRQGMGGEGGRGREGRGRKGRRRGGTFSPRTLESKSAPMEGLRKVLNRIIASSNFLNFKGTEQKIIDVYSNVYYDIRRRSVTVAALNI
jgi:hypothetical protein